MTDATGTKLTLAFTYMAVNIEGENLEPLYHELRKRKVGALKAFEDGKDTRPEAGQPIITNITRQVPKR